MSPEVKSKIKKAVTPVYRSGLFLTVLAGIFQSHFDYRIQQMADDTRYNKAMLNHMNEKIDTKDRSDDKRFSAIEDNHKELKLDFRTHCTNEDNRIAALWRRGKKNNQTDTLNPNQN